MRQTPRSAASDAARRVDRPRPPDIQEQNRSVTPSTAADTASIVSLVMETLDDNKAQDVVEIDLQGKTSIADAMVVASGRSDRHVKSIADHILRRLKEAGHGKLRSEGLAHGDWVLVDAGDVIVHVFRPEVREFYNIERMWQVEHEAGRVAV
ncbi:MAG: ribosome silencing factor [Alphaproteobacteria bacterium]|nr:ribosome silencing factor [Alphaproteobacteria bacterium]